MIKSGNNESNLRVNKKEVERIYGEFLTALGYDWKNDSNMRETPYRVTKMMLEEITVGTYSNSPKTTVFINDGGYDGMVFSGNIEINSLCSHHMLPFIGVAHVAYLTQPQGYICGLSKLNRIVDWFCRRPQLQEQLTIQIHSYIDEIIGINLGVAVVIEAQHTCVQLRGVKQGSIMKTSKLSGAFLDNKNLARTEFYDFINQLK